MATAQKRGFRFPWGGDAHRDESSPDGAGSEGLGDADVATRVGPDGDDLGEGPFGPTDGPADADAAADTAAPTEPPVDATTDPSAGPTAATTADALETLDRARAAWPESDRRTVGPLASTSRTRPALAPQAPAQSAAAEVPVVTSAPDVPVEPAASGRSNASAEHATSTRVPDLPAGSPGSPPAESAAGASRRRDNPLVAGLVRAMREAARTARDETVSALHADAAARTEAIRAQSAVAVTELKKLAEADVVSIKDWSRAELARVRAETETRIEDRRTQLVAETEAAGRAAENLMARLHETLEAFEAEMGQFFDVLLAEDDPARLAGLAERMPTAPDLEAFPTAEADAEPVTEPEPAVTADAVATDDPSADAVTAESDGATQETGDPRLGWLDHLDSDAAAAAEAEALAGLDRHTNLVVSGLSSVAGIAAFKSVLVHVDGVSAVSVTAGANGDVLFTVTHDGQSDLRDAIQAMEAFETHLIADDGDTLSVAAREPAA